MSRLRASIVVVGDEILGGFVQDTNSGWVAGRLRAHGVPLERVVTVADDVEAIVEALSSELARSRPRVVMTSGGIGSTPDDRTMEAVACHLGVPLVEEPAIAARIAAALEWTAAQGLSVDPEHAQSMRKMALVPATAYLLPGARGVVPGVAVDVDGGSRASGATVVVLPGVPGELHRIVSEGVEPQLLAGRGRREHVAEITHSYPEATLNPALAEVIRRYPQVHVGSYPGQQCVIRLQGPPEPVAAAAALVTAAVERLDAEPGAAAVRNAWRRRW